MPKDSTSNKTHSIKVHNNYETLKITSFFYIFTQETIHENTIDIMEETDKRTQVSNDNKQHFEQVNNNIQNITKSSLTALTYNFIMDKAIDDFYYSQNLKMQRKDMM